MSKNTKDPWVRIIDVSNPVLHKKGYTLYKVTSKVFPKNSVEAVTEVTVWKRYNDFKKLHKALSTIHQNLHLKGTFPAFAKARLFGRFDDSVIEERRQSALQLLQFAASYPPLFTSQVFVKFFEDGYKIESSEPKKKIEEKTEVNILQPSRCRQKSDVLLSSFSDSKTKSLETNCKGSNNSLGGTWQHHQVPDNISLGSHCTDDDDDDDDHTTFTDDDGTISRPSFNLLEFDPLLESKGDGSEQPKSPLTVDNVCNNWLLSALESCSTSNTEKDVEGMLEFPTPFDDFENIDEAVTPSNKSASSFNLNSGSGSNQHFTFDSPVSASVETCAVMEFDPLVSQENNIKEAENDVCNSDEFAMTPDAYKGEAAHRPSYIIYASKYVLHAQEAEESGKYPEAFDSYKKAIDVLLQGIKKEPCPDLRDAVRKKVYLYLMRAEEIYENKLPKSVNSTEPKVPSPLSVSPTLTVTSLKGSVQDLSKYKVLGILGKVLLVLDIFNNCTYVVKTLYKSSNPRNMNTSHIIPQNVPFMVKIFQIYETSYALFLVLEHATGGRLWDYVSSYLQRSPLSPYNEDAYLYMEPRNRTELCNVYSGKKVSDESSAENADIVKSLDSDLVASKTSPSSYVALFKKYAVTSDKEQKVALAKYRRYPSMPCNEKGHLKKYLDKEKTFHDSRTLCVSSDADNSDKNETDVQNKKNQQQRNSRNRLSSSTGSLEIALSQKTCHLEVFDAMDEAVFKASSKPIHLPESCIYLWAAEIVVALDSLHKLGIIWMDFQPDNILLGTEGHILLTYQGYWNDVDFVVNEISQDNFFCAPEVGNIFPVTSDCDWWSLGVILYELLTGRSLVSCHPTGITMHTILNFPPDVSPDAKDFVSKLLQYNSTERLGSGVYGIEEIKCHPFFRFVDWESLYQT